MSTEPSITEVVSSTESLFLGGSVMVAAFAFFRWFLTLAGGRQDKRIAQLERERSEDRKMLMAVTQALFEVMNAVEHHDPNNPALEHARSVLKKVFPADSAKE